MAMMDFKTDSELSLDSSVRTAEVIVLAEPGTKSGVEEENLKFGPLVSYINKQYQKSKDKRLYDEQRWLRAYHNYRGIYGPDVQFTDTEKSRVFIKITKTKVLAAYAQILDILFSAGKFPLGVEASAVPVGVADSVHFDPKTPPEITRSATVARQDITDLLGPLKDKLTPVADKLQEGPGRTQSSVTYEPAKEAATEMDKKFQDQLEEGQADKKLRSFIFDMALFGTGIFRGPLVIDKEYPRWTKDGEYDPVIVTAPDFSYVPLWDAYPDADARNMAEAEKFIHRHRLSRTGLRDLKRRPYFRTESIELAIAAGPNYIREYWENELNDGSIQPEIDRFEVLEYWGIVDKDIAEQAGLTIPAKLKDRDQFQINAWICNDYVLRVVLNPLTPARIPYYACPYELNPYSFFGIGIAENMEDTQLVMNGAFRNAIDNFVLSSNVILDIDETLMADGQDLQLKPGKVFRRQGGQPGTAVNAIQIPNVTQQAIMIFDKARQLSDESTGMPSYSHGQSGVTGMTRTASGMSMLMGAAKENIKAVVKNIDDYLLIPFGKSLFAFNMQFNFDPKYIGDLEVVAKGTESLMRNEIRSQKLMQFLQIASNPMDAPWVKRDYVLREIAADLDLEADKLVNDPREAALQAVMLADMNKAMGINPQEMPQANGNPAGMPSVSDPTQTGGGNMVPGAAPMPGAQGSTAAGGGSPQAAAAVQAQAGQ